SSTAATGRRHTRTAKDGRPPGRDSDCDQRIFSRLPGEGGCQEILRTGQFVVPAKAGTQEQVAEIPGFPLSRERRIWRMRAANFVLGLHPSTKFAALKIGRAHV